MEKNLWRKCAVVVAFVDVGFSFIAMMTAIMLTSECYRVLKDGLEYKLEATDVRLRLVRNWWTWVVIGSFDLVTVLQVWASLKLFGAALLAGKNFREHLGNVRIWEKVTFLLIFLDVVFVAAVIHAVGLAGVFGIGGFVLGVFIFTVGVIFSRGIFLFIVAQYMKELEKRLVSVRVGKGLKLDTWISRKGFRQVV